MFNSQKIFLTLRSFFPKKKRYNSTRFPEVEIDYVLGFKPKSYPIYRLAFINKQFVSDTGKNNERLEFLGDAALGLIIANYLFKKYPYKGEDFLTEMRSKVVKRDTLNLIAQKMRIPRLLELKAMSMAKEEDHAVVPIENIDAAGDALEALIGAIYIDKGISFATRWVEDRIIKEHINFNDLEKVDANLKNRLHSWIAKHKKEIVYNVDKVEDAKGVKIFTISIRVDDDIIGIGSGFSKKEASARASEQAIKRMNI